MFFLRNSGGKCWVDYHDQGFYALAINSPIGLSTSPVIWKGVGCNHNQESQSMYFRVGATELSIKL